MHDNDNQLLLSRRSLIKGLGAAALLTAAPMKFAAAGFPSARQLAFENTHTGDKLKVTYWDKGRYLPDALAEINHILRDHRNDKSHKMDPKLIDMLYSMQQTLETRSPYYIISGYRSPESNAKLHAHSGGVAKGSLHMQGKAIDIRLKDRSTGDIRKVAMAMQSGGVGYYPASDFVHVDTGRVRHW